MENYTKRSFEHMPAWVVAVMIWALTSPNLKPWGENIGWPESLLGAVIVAVGLIMAVVAVAVAGSLFSAWLACQYEDKIENGKHQYAWGIGAFVVFVSIVWIFLYVI